MKRSDPAGTRARWARPAVLAAVFAAALALRLVGLGDLPLGLFCDEAANGADAYRLLTTGESLGGDRWPLLLDHHGIDWVEPLYTYGSIPAVALFGLSAFSTRLLAAIAGSLLVLTTYALVRRLAGREEALVAAVLTAVSPWLFTFSRIGFRGILLPLFLTAALALFVDGIGRRYGATGARGLRSLALSGLLFGLTLQTYTVAKAVVPLALLALLALYRRELVAIAREPGPARRGLGIGAALLAGLAAYSYLSFLFGPGGTRFDAVSVFGRPQPARQIAANLVLQFDPLFLFLGGDGQPRSSIGGIGPVLPVLLPLVVVGLVAAARRRSRAGWLALALFVAGGVPAALTLDGPHALRGIAAAPYLEILAALGAVAVVRAAKSAPRRRLLAVALGLLIAANAGIFFSAYFDRYPERSAYAFQYGLEEAVATAERGRDSYAAAVLSARINQAYVFPIFYAPAQTDADRDDYYRPLARGGGAVTMPAGRYLYIVRGCEQVRGAEARPVAEIKGPDGYLFLALYELDLARRTRIGVTKRWPCALPFSAAGWPWAERVTRRYHRLVRTALGGEPAD